jgi:hypothetical protein
MDLCLITPIEYTEISNLLPGRFCIGSIALKHEKYKNYFIEASKQGYSVILDNGVFEGDNITDEEYIDLALEINPEVLVCPDILGGDTYTNIEKGITFTHLARQSGFIKDFMIVMQCPYNCEDFYWKGIEEVLFNDSLFNWIGICRQSSINAFQPITHAVDELNRFYFTNKLQSKYTSSDILKKKWHFLGIEERVDLIQYYWFVSSMDTASLFYQSYLGSTIENGVLPTIQKRPKDYFTRDYIITNPFQSIIKTNCQEAQQYAQAATDLKRKIINGWVY